MCIRVAHLNYQAGGHDFIMNFCIHFHCFCLETALSIFIWKEIHKMVDIGSNESRNKACQPFSSGFDLET